MELLKQSQITPAEQFYTNRVLIAVSIGAFAAVTGLLIVFGSQVFLMIFAGILFAAPLNRLAHLLKTRSGLSYGWSYGGVVLLMTLLAFGSLWLLGSRIASQLEELVSQVSAAKEQSVVWISQYSWGKSILRDMPNMNQLLESRGWSPFSGINSLFSSVTGIFTTGFVIVFLALYFGASPHVYIDGIVRIIVPSRRRRVREVLIGLGDTLCKWMLGRLASMAIIAVGGAVGLWFLGVPLPITLGVLAGLLTFIPNIGGFLGVVPPALLALRQSPEAALWVLALFALLQLVESNLLTPLIQQHQVSVPPGLLLAAQVLMGVLTGILGVAMATPFVAVLLVLVRELYVVDVLEGQNTPD